MRLRPASAPFVQLFRDCCENNAQALSASQFADPAQEWDDRTHCRFSFQIISTTMASKLTKYMTSPSRIASSFDWKRLSGAVLSMNISNKTINLALASHPSCDDKIMNLPDIPLQLDTQDNKRVVNKKVLQELQDICQKNKVCGIVVAWPIQKEGRMGHDCGKVLHTLDSLASYSQVLTPNRPFCLWDGRHIPEEHDDEWGRAARYGQSSCDDNKTIHYASKEQYNQSTHLDAADVCSDFFDSLWPELAVERRRVQQGGKQRPKAPLYEKQGDSAAFSRPNLLYERD